MIEWIISSSVLILVVIGLRTMLKGKISLRLQYALWALVLLRLLIPVNFGSSAMSVSNLTAAEEVSITAEPVQESPQLNLVPNQPQESNTHIHQDQAQPGKVDSEEKQQTTRKVDWKDAARITWVAGMILVGTAFCVTNLHFRKKIMVSREPMNIYKDGLTVYVSDRIDTPCLFGLLKPAIYITYPAAADATLLRHTLAHEATHFRHRDHVWALLRCACIAIHWYNPLVWWAAFLSRQDGELACDEGTIAQLGEGERTEYGRTLIGMTCQKKANVLIAATTMNSGKRSLKERILLIARKPKMAVYTLISVVMIAVLAVGCTFTGARQDRTNALEKLPEFLEDYCYEQVKDRMDREDVQYLGSVNDYSLIHCSGTGPQLIVIRHEIQGNQIIVKGQSEGEYVITGGLSVNHLVDGDKHIYFGLISDTYWVPEDDAAMSLDWKDLVFWDAAGNQKIVTFGDNGYIVALDEPITDFWVVVNGGNVPLKMEDYLSWGYEIHQCSWNSEGQTIEATEPTQAATEPMPTEIPDNAPPVNLQELLHEQPDPEKICIGVQPTALSQFSYDLYYIIPENQEILLEYYLAAEARATELFWDNNVKMTGWYICYQGKEWQVFEDGSLRGEMTIAGEDAKELYAFCQDAIREAGIGEPVRPEDITGIISATLYWNGDQAFTDPGLLKGAYTVTDPIVLNRLETLFANSSYYGSVRCPFTAHLELTLENGETNLLAMSTDSCASWMSQGVAYGYGVQTNVGIEGNEEFYSFFLADIIHEKAKEGPEAVAKYWPYVNWGLYSRKYSIDDTFALMDLFKAYVLENPTDWMICVALSTPRGLDGAFAQYYANVIGEIFEAAPATFNFACRQMVPEQYVEDAVNFLAFYWNITPEEARVKLEAAQTP